MLDWMSGSLVGRWDLMAFQVAIPTSIVATQACRAERRRKYYMGEGDGFPRARAVVSQVSPRLLVACPNTKSVQNEL